MIMAFVNSDQPLWKNGNNIILNNDNKERHFWLTTFDILIEKKVLIVLLIQGFNFLFALVVVISFLDHSLFFDSARLQF